MGNTITLTPETATLAPAPTRELVARYQTSTLEAMLQRRVRRSVEQALGTLGEDSILFLPTQNQQTPGLAAWSQERRARFEQLLQSALQEEFEELETDWSEAIPALVDRLWHGIEGQLVQIALRSLATRWILRKLGDGVSLGEIEPVESGWRAPLGIRGRAGAVGQLVLDSAGRIVEEKTSSRQELGRRASAA